MENKIHTDFLLPITFDHDRAWEKAQQQKAKKAAEYWKKYWDDKYKMEKIVITGKLGFEKISSGYNPPLILIDDKSINDIIQKIVEDEVNEKQGLDYFETKYNNFRITIEKL